jgi:phosphoenolpyruvate synthase/pyruvate phosphate dikinase
MTNPDYVPIMKIAAGVVTDEGGATCHAAIASRELKIPCIVGTKFATKMLEDGDLVEVDANKGLVTILDNGDRASIEKWLSDAKEYKNVGRWFSNPLVWSFWIMSCTSEYAKKNKGFDYKRPPNVVVDHNFYIYQTGTYEKLVKTIFAELTAKKQKLTIEYLFKTSEKIEQFANKILRQYQNNYGSDEFLKASFQLHLDSVFPWEAMFTYMEDAVEQAIEHLGKKHDMSLADIQALVPQRKTLSMQDGDKLRKFKKEFKQLGITKKTSFSNLVKKHPALAKRLEKYQKDTEYTGTHHLWGDPRQMSGLLEAIFLVNEQESEHGLKVGKLPSEIKDLVNVISWLSYWRLQLAEVVARVTYLIQPHLTEIAERSGVTYPELLNATYQEVLDAMNHGKKLDKAELVRRQKKFGVGVFNNQQKVEIVTGQELELLEKHFDTHKKSLPAADSKEISGQIGNKGFVTGKVVVVFGPKEINKVKEGMILVAPETTPDFIAAMSKAAAFVTDRGGITSHAAIVAREMRKPCIIGTKIGTQVLKDGDMVEVDANNGIVRKI